MTVINMVKSDAGEAMHLFEVMQKHGVKCSLEMKHGNADPMVSIASAAVQTEYVEGSDGDTVVVSLNDVNLAFPLGEYSYSKFISDIQIDIAIASEIHTAWFSSAEMSPEAIEAAKIYDSTGGEFDDKEVWLDAADETTFDDQLHALKLYMEAGQIIKSTQTIGGGNQILTVGYEATVNAPVGFRLDGREQALISFIRGLSFDDILDATNSLFSKADHTQLEAIQWEDAADRVRAKGFRERAGNLRELAELLGLANTDYCAHILATESETNDAGK
ncbi:hypothetical protein AB4Z29_24955 [Paenibacillus sp. 2TAB23]|uniref:hypothetical protein n=1 Tax=Paenibacillus sp. 2TAB23 TaxID=3233004 RepID=UPI003F9A3AC5